MNGCFEILKQRLQIPLHTEKKRKPINLKKNVTETFDNSIDFLNDHFSSIANALQEETKVHFRIKRVYRSILII